MAVGHGSAVQPLLPSLLSFLPRLPSFFSPSYLLVAQPPPSPVPPLSAQHWGVVGAFQGEQLTQSSAFAFPRMASLGLDCIISNLIETSCPAGEAGATESQGPLPTALAGGQEARVDSATVKQGSQHRD